MSEKHECKTCKYEKLGLRDEPCSYCGYPSKMWELAEKTYTLADLEQARKQGAEDERGRCKEAVHKIDTDPEFILNYRSGFYEGRRCAEVAIEALGPIGETREETERRVRRETVEKAWEAIAGAKGDYFLLREALDVIAEGKQDAEED